MIYRGESGFLKKLSNREFSKITASFKFFYTFSPFSRVIFTFTFVSKLIKLASVLLEDNE